MVNGIVQRREVISHPDAFSTVRPVSGPVGVSVSYLNHLREHHGGKVVIIPKGCDACCATCSSWRTASESRTRLHPCRHRKPTICACSTTADCARLTIFPRYDR